LKRGRRVRRTRTVVLTERVSRTWMQVLQKRRMGSRTAGEERIKSQMGGPSLRWSSSRRAYSGGCQYPGIDS
jgi:hypothetical protein